MKWYTPQLRQKAGQVFEVLADLGGKLAGGRQDQRLDVRLFGVAVLD